VIRIDGADMATVLLLLARDDVPVAISATMGEALARLGVTRLAVLQDGSTVSVLLEGWAFDASSTNRAIEAIDVPRSGVRVLAPVLDASVSTLGAGSIAVRPEGETR
jgi:hypothetical protein